MTGVQVFATTASFQVSCLTFEFPNLFIIILFISLSAPAPKVHRLSATTQQADVNPVLADIEQVIGFGREMAIVSYNRCLWCYTLFYSKCF